ncbi:Retrovirus-related Pol polyprotein from transposon TNT 1-94 [Vitis vinifera]|uniref:Retrovirus-related Pol polyprotein from transposon TNT 1-94 n=1 Tax=Vitis vinifera TaxID=29760 RepID=A0A438H674_VITVI|nr:Retrovirus-related Pol polyprotein from transposon TNT 1-94 [Vitis vinifera]
MTYTLSAASEVDDQEPLSYKEAIKSRHNKHWVKSMHEEMKSLEKKQTWILVKKPENQKLVGCKWIFKSNKGILGKESPRYKALVAKGFTQQLGVDYNEIFSPVVKHTSIRTILSIVAKEDLELEQMDVKTAFLHGDL